MDKYNRTSNAVYSLNYHLIVVVKYRQKVFVSDTIVSTLKEQILAIGEGYGVDIIEQECGEDHIHILFSAKPTLDITKFINVVKGRTARNLRKEYKEELKTQLWGDSFWSPSYFLASSGNVSLDTLINYVNSQRTLQE